MCVGNTIRNISHPDIEIQVKLGREHKGKTRKDSPATTLRGAHRALLTLSMLPRGNHCKEDAHGSKQRDHRGKGRERVSKNMSNSMSISIVAGMDQVHDRPKKIHSTQGLSRGHLDIPTELINGVQVVKVTARATSTKGLSVHADEVTNSRCRLGQR